jgi:predicted ribosome quality control (RQC) complex YloA/Tae2 family protein
MSLNWREIALIVEELPFADSVLQGVVQHDFHSLSWNFYHSQHGRWTLYTEMGTPYSRLHMATRPLAVQQFTKTAKLQRFVQFCRANLEGGRVVSVKQVPFDRMVQVTLDNHGNLVNLYLRFYSGPGANIIATDENNEILDLLYRRPGRDEKSGSLFILPEEKTEDSKDFKVRERIEGSFNRQIEDEYSKSSNEETLHQTLAKVTIKRDRLLKQLEATTNSLKRKMLENGKFEIYKLYGDLLSSNIHLVKPHEATITLEDWTTGKPLTITLDPKLSPNANITLFYDRFQKAKGTYENAKTEYEKAHQELVATQEKYEQVLTLTGNETKDIQRLKRELGTETADKPTVVPTVGLTIKSGQYTLLVGRNVKENEELLRHYAKGNDYWMHTRDCPGGYVFIKFLKGKNVPLDVLLDAGNLALVFSKAKKDGKADLYYTQVKYLRKPKGAKAGLVLPTQEKNLSVTLDEGRLARLLLEDEHA